MSEQIMTVTAQVISRGPGAGDLEVNIQTTNPDSLTPALRNAARRAAVEQINRVLGKPVEPTGVGAVVEDVDGSLLVRLRTGDFPWVESTSGSYWRWSNLDVVRVLSEGVTE